MILYALTHGVLDSIPVNSILDFEAQLFEYLETNHSDLFATIRDTKDLPDANKLDGAIQEFKDILMLPQRTKKSIIEVRIKHGILK